MWIWIRSVAWVFVKEVVDILYDIKSYPVGDVPYNDSVSNVGVIVVPYPDVMGFALLPDGVAIKPYSCIAMNECVIKYYTTTSAYSDAQPKILPPVFLG